MFFLSAIFWGDPLRKDVLFILVYCEGSGRVDRIVFKMPESSQSICRALKSLGNWMCLSCAHVATIQVLMSTAAEVSRASMLCPQSSGHRPVYCLDLQAHLGEEIQHEGLKL